MRFEVGDTVVISQFPKKGYLLSWDNGMSDHCGCSGEITSIDYIDGFRIYAVHSVSKLGIEKSWWFQEEWLEPDRGYYWTTASSRKEMEELGLEELKREERAIRLKQEEIFKKIFSDNTD